jgi:iron complex outermembrane receptor protein
MKNLHATRSRRRQPLRVNPVAAAVAALLCTGEFAHAQQDPPAPATQTVTVTGIRRGIESAIATKQNADGVVEAISAEDIGKLPDTSIAESLARLPGVTTQRDRNGNATNISIRGLGPDFNGYLLNGREQTSTGDSRAVDLSVYPAELIGSAVVYKTSDASLAGSGLAGTIDNRLIDPLAFGSRVIAGSIVQTKSGVGLDVTGKGKRYSLSYIDQFADRTLGVAIGFVHSDGNSNSLASGSWSQNVNATLKDGTKVSGVSNPFTGGLSVETDVNTDKRDGFAAILNYKPNKNFQSELDVYSGKIKTGTKKNALKAGTNGSDVFNATVSGTTVTSGTINMAPGALIVYGENVFDDDKIDSLGWKNMLKFGDGWTASVDLSSNKAKRVEKDIEVYAGIATADTLTFTSNGNNPPTLSVGNPSAYTDPTKLMVRDQSGWSGVSYPAGSPYAGQTVPQAGYSKGPTVTDKLSALRFDFRKDLGDAGMGWFTDVQFGLNYSKRTKDRTTDEGLIVSSANGGYDRIPYPGGYVVSNIGGTGINALTFDPQDGLWPGATLLRKYNDDILSKTWSVAEKLTTAYAKLNIDTTLVQVPVSGNVGVQLVNTDQSSAGYRSNATSDVTLTNPAAGLSSDGTKYTDFLPSLNLKGDLGGGNVLRFGLGKQLARPTLTDLRNSFGIGTNNNLAVPRLQASSGNPYLKPFKATALDLSYEKYFANKAYFSVAGFYKKLDTYIISGTAQVDLGALATQYHQTIPAAGPIGFYTTTANGQGGNISGVELAVSAPFNMLTRWLDGFGGTASYSSTSSNVNLPNTIGLNPTQQVPVGGGSIQLPGLSKVNSKITLYYERAGFSAFVSQAQRSAYIGSVANSTVGGYPALVRIDAQTWVSAQIGYEFQDGTLKGLGFRFEGNNLNKPTYREDTGSSINTNKTGATYGFKLNYKYL